MAYTKKTVWDGLVLVIAHMYLFYISSNEQMLRWRQFYYHWEQMQQVRKKKSI